MKVTIESDGNGNNTFVKDVETGQKIDMVKSITWTCDAQERIATAEIEIYFVPSHLTGVAKMYCNDLTEQIVKFIEEKFFYWGADIASAVRDEFIGKEI